MRAGVQQAGQMSKQGHMVRVGDGNDQLIPEKPKRDGAELLGQGAGQAVRGLGIDPDVGKIHAHRAVIELLAPGLPKMLRFDQTPGQGNFTEATAAVASLLLQNLVDVMRREFAHPPEKLSHACAAHKMCPFRQPDRTVDWRAASP